MPKRCFLLMLIVFFLTSCTRDGSKAPVSIADLPYKSSTQYRSVTSFNQIEAEGQINMSLHTGYKKPQVILKGDPRDLAQVHTTVSNGTLYVTLGKGFPHYGLVYAEVRGQFLNRLSYKGRGVVKGTRIHTRVLDVFLANEGLTQLGGSIGLRRLMIAGNGVTRISGINSRNLQLHFLKGNPGVQLSGIANVTELTMKGSAWFSMYWLKSDTLTIRAGQQSRLQLAGTVNRLDVELWGTARFKGRYLRAQRSFVKTHDHSVAQISSVKHQSTLATDASDIYYYNLPATREDFMAYNGSVLDMREWNRVEIKDFDRYNKQFP